MHTIKRFSFTPILGWSVSRFDKFNLCKRQYFYDYYAKFDPEISRAKIVELKKLTSIALETGNIVHDVIKTLLERLLKSEKKIDKSRFFDYSRKLTNDYCNEKIFSEIYYKKKDIIDINNIFENVKLSLENFLNSPRYTFLLEKALVNKQNWVIEPDGYGETRISGLKAYCKVDFLFPIEEKIYILDWKTGKASLEKHKKQIIGYTAWASYHYGVSPENIKPGIVYLKPSYNELAVNVGTEDIISFGEAVKKETEEMYSFCSNFEENIPVEKEKFKMTTNSKICNFCNYYELCYP